MTMHPMSQPERNAEIRQLVFDEGVAPITVAKRYGVTESRIAQILHVTTNRQRISSLLAERDRPWTIDEIAAELALGQKATAFYVESLRKKGVVVVDDDGTVTLLRRQPTAEAANQKVSILQTLSVKGTQLTLELLSDAMTGMGYPFIDAHNLHHVLWSLQKQGFVTFKDKNNGSARQLRNLAITAAGKGWLQQRGHDIWTTPLAGGPVVEAVDEDAVAAVDRVAEAAAAMGFDVQPQPPREEIAVEPVAAGAPEGPWIKGNIGGWPELRSIRDRARVAKKREQAARLLAETGDDDIALQIMEMTSFTALDLEVIHLLELFGEL